MSHEQVVTNYQGRRKRGAQWAHAPPHQFFQRTKSALFRMKSALFVQADVTISTKLTSKVLFLFGNFDVFKTNW